MLPSITSIRGWLANMLDLCMNSLIGYIWLWSKQNKVLIQGLLLIASTDLLYGLWFPNAFQANLSKSFHTNNAPIM